MTKITPEHLARGAFVYIRQSTADQVMNNVKSQRRQYGVKTHRTLTPPKVAAAPVFWTVV